MRTAERPNERLGVEVMTCQITRPTTGELVNGRRTTETRCEASWDIAADDDEAMRDFEVTSSASSEGVGDLRSVQTFKYKEMGANRRRRPRTAAGAGGSPSSGSARP